MSEPALRLLFLGDVCAAPGRAAVAKLLPGLRQELGLGCVIANGENAAAGYGLTPKHAEELFAAGVDVLTAGDHVFDRKEAWEYLGAEPRLLRPLNYPPDAPGRGAGVFDCGGTRVAVVSLLGRVFMKPVDCPFRRALPVVKELLEATRVVVVDVHAEATAEKQALGRFLDGHASAVLGSHTHVQTADERLLPGGTAYITDAGMCGSFDSILGMQKEPSLRRFVDGVPVKLVAATGDVRLNGVLVDVEPASGRALRIERLVRRLDSD